MMVERDDEVEDIYTEALKMACCSPNQLHAFKVCFWLRGSFISNRGDKPQSYTVAVGAFDSVALPFTESL